MSKHPLNEEQPQQDTLENMPQRPKIQWARAFKIAFGYLAAVMIIGGFLVFVRIMISHV